MGLFKATLEIFSQFSYFRNIGVILDDVVRDIFFELDILGEQKLHEKVKQLWVFLLVKVVISEHSITSHDCKSPFVVVHAGNRSVDWVAQGARRQNGLGWILNVQTGSVGKDEIQASLLFFLLKIIFILFFQDVG